MDKAIVAGEGVTIIGEGNVKDVANLGYEQELARMKKKVASRARRYSNSNIFNQGYRKWRLKRAVKKYKRAKKYINNMEEY